MAVVLDAVPGSITGNSYLTPAEFQDYLDSRIDLPAGIEVGEKDLISATRTLNAMLSPYRAWVPPTSGVNAREGYFFTRPTWTGAPTTTTQVLPWARTGMFDRVGNPIPDDVYPIELKEATAELAIQMKIRDTMLDNATAVKGIKRIKAGPVDIEYRNDIMTSKVLPDYVLFLLVPSWLTEEVIESVGQDLIFDVIS